MDKLAIVGAGGHGKVVASTVMDAKQYKEIVFVDGSKNNDVMGIKVISDDNSLETIITEYDFFVAIGNNGARKRLIEKIESLGGKVVTIIHPTAVIAKDVEIENGTFISANSVINASAKIGKGVIINTLSVVEHDCKIGDYTHVCPGSAIAGTVTVGENCFLGVGTKCVNNVSICDNVTLGAGSVVIDNINESGKYVGVPVKKIG